ncbi:MAG TPA: cupredoxin domain-containing protein [Candidatus Limnocylindrales bacterium]
MIRLARGAGILLLAGTVLVACTASAGAGGPPPSAPTGGAVVTAQNIAFDRGQLAVPAGRPFQLLFENREGAPHNVRIYDDVDQPLFVGEIFGGPGSRTYEVPAIPAGTHRFRCDVHPDMAGTVIAG